MRWRWLLVGVGLLLMVSEYAVAEAIGLDSEIEYNVTLQIAADEAKTLTALHILASVKIGSREFLVVIPPGYRTHAFIDVSSIRAIIPTKQGLATSY